MAAEYGWTPKETENTENAVLEELIWLQHETHRLSKRNMKKVMK